MRKLQVVFSVILFLKTAKQIINLYTNFYYITLNCKSNYINCSRAALSLVTPLALYYNM